LFYNIARTHSALMSTKDFPTAKLICKQ